MSARLLRCWGPALSAALALTVIPHLSARTPAASEKTIFVSALDASGRPVKDLTTDEFRLREDGVDREIVSVKPAGAPLQIALLADSTDEAGSLIRDIRVSLNAFVHQVQSASPDASISLVEFGQAAVTIVPFVTSGEALEAGINKLVGRPGAASVLMEAIVDASNNLAKRPSPRRAIVALNLEPSDEQSREDPNKVADALRKSVAQLWSVSLQRGTLKNPKRDVVLNTLTKNTGGNREFIVGQSAVETVLKAYADALTSQYEVTYKRPGGSARVVQVGVTRQGLKLHASGFAPQ